MKMKAKSVDYEHEPLLPLTKPVRSLTDLEEALADIYSSEGPTKNSFDKFSLAVRGLEGAVCRKYESLHEEKKKELVLHEFGETVEVIEELQGKWQWLFRIPSLLLTVVIASSCIPLAKVLEEVLQNNPILGGFPPAVSAAAGCIGIQNTAIIIRALGLRLIEPSWKIFGWYAFVSVALSFIAAVVEALVALLVVKLQEESEGQKLWEILIKDVPAVIFVSMLFVGTIAGVMGAGIPMLVTWLSAKIGKRLDPAHWVGPIETVAQEFSATVLTLYVAQLIIENALEETSG